MINDLIVKSNIKNYAVCFENNFDFLEEYRKIHYKSIIIDRNVFELYNDLFLSFFEEEDIYIFDAIEENKTIIQACHIYDWLCQRNAKKNMTMISIGGGITQDVTGFVASTLYRGINWIFIPTTLLSQTDSCIGSKTSINYQKYKNLIGTFYPPSKLHINTVFVHTLKEVDFYSGIGEIIKLQLMKEEPSKDLFLVSKCIKKCIVDYDYLQKIVFDNLNIKLRYMEGDEFDNGRRNLLNYGHCFGHALEVSSSYKIPHGIAVNIGIIFANIIANRRRMLNSVDFDFITDHINLPNIGMKLKKGYFDYDILLSALKNDKKREGDALAIVFPNRSFALNKYNDMSEKEFKYAFDGLLNILFKGVINE
jgi:3-dehydroquinate synthase